MRSSTFLFSIAAVTVALALGGCSRKADVNAEASKAEEPFAMKEAPAQVPPGNPAATAEPRAEGNADVTAVPPAAAANGAAPPATAANDAAPAAVAARSAQAPSGVTIAQRSSLGQSSQATTTNFSESVAMKARLRNGRKATTEAQ